MAPCVCQIGEGIVSTREISQFSFFLFFLCNSCPPPNKKTRLHFHLPFTLQVRLCIEVGRMCGGWEGRQIQYHTRCHSLAAAPFIKRQTEKGVYLYIGNKMILVFLSLFLALSLLAFYSPS